MGPSKWGWYLNELPLSLCWLDWTLAPHLGPCLLVPQCWTHLRTLQIHLPDSPLPLPAQFLCCPHLSRVTWNHYISCRRVWANIFWRSQTQDLRSEAGKDLHIAGAQREGANKIKRLCIWNKLVTPRRNGQVEIKKEHMTKPSRCHETLA